MSLERSENNVRILEMRFSNRTCDQAFVCKSLYEVETSKEVVDKSLERSCNISYVQMRARNFVEAEEGDVSGFVNVVSSHGNSLIPFEVAVKSRICGNG